MKLYEVKSVISRIEDTLKVLISTRSMIQFRDLSPAELGHLLIFNLYPKMVGWDVRARQILLGKSHKNWLNWLNII